MEKVEAVFECAVFAMAFDLDESERLLAFGYQQGQLTASAYLSSALDDQFDDPQSAYQVFKNVRELAAFDLGIIYGRVQLRLNRDAYETDDLSSTQDWKTKNKREYNKRNCSLIGK